MRREDMRYSKEQIGQLDAELTNCLRALFELQSSCVEHAQHTDNPKAIEYLNQGVNRRLIILRHALAKIFMAIPPDIQSPASRENTLDAQVNLYAFLIGVVGIFDNLAWVYAYHHNLHDLLRRRQSVDLFKQQIQKHLPSELTSYLMSDTTVDWYEKHFKTYRDALAHRIPPYIPSVFVKTENSAVYQDLSSQRMIAQATDNYTLAESLSTKLALLEQPNLTYMQSFDSSEGSRPVLLHPQLLCDASTIVEFCQLFFKHWRSASNNSFKPTPLREST